MKERFGTFVEKAEPKKTLPVGTILTYAAAGSEASWSSVITNEGGLYKRTLENHLIIPVFSIMSPELTFTLSNYQTMCGIFDIMSHAFERYFTKTSYVDLTDRLCEGVLKTVINQARILLEDSFDYDARAEVM